MTRPPLAGIVAALVSAVFTLGAAEVALQLLDYPPAAFSPWIQARDTAYRYAPSLHTRMVRPDEFNVAFDTNGQGLRDDEITPKHGERILLLGDSFASGYGVERGQMFADLLQQRLGVEVVNAGVGGYEIVHQVHYFASRGHELRPDLVVYALYLGNDLSRNDEWSSTPEGGLTSEARSFPLRRPHELKLLALYRQFRYGRSLKEEHRKEWEPFPDYLLVAKRELSDEGLEDYGTVEKLLGELRDEVRQAGAELFIVLIPYRTMVDDGAHARLAAKMPDFDQRYDLALPGVRTEAILDRLGVAWFDLSPALRAQLSTSSEALYFPVDGHLNVHGHAVVADALEPVLRKRMEELRTRG